MKLGVKEFKTAFARYAIGKQLGEGGAGIVFAAVDDANAPVAVKVLRPSVASGDKLKRFKNEIAFCQSANDPHIIAVLDYGLIETTDGEAACYVMPQYGGTLRRRMKSGVTPDDAARLANELFDAVEAAHLRRVWHRDIKPENFLIRDDGALVLSDFGVAHIHADLLETAVETGPQDRLANFEYAAPEQRRKGATVDQRCDLWAVGLILNELFTGEVPLGKGHRRVADVAPAHGYFDEIVDWMTQQDPDGRPAKIDEVRLRLMAMKAAVHDRRRLAAAENRVVPIHVADDPLISAPPKVVDVDVNGQTLIIHLDVAPTQRWIETFKNINFRNALMGGEPRDFGFHGKQASIMSRYNDLNAANAQQLVNDFKRFVDYTTEKYRGDVERAIREKNAAEVNRKAAEIAEEKRRSQIRQQITF